MKKLYYLVFICILTSGIVYAVEDAGHVSDTIITRTSNIDSLIINQRWVLEANQLIFKNKSDYNVDGNINFILVDGTSAAIQLGKNTELDPKSKQSIINQFETNNLGGMTISGEVVGYKIVEKKKGQKVVYMTVKSILGSFNIRLDCNQKTAAASAIVKGNSFAQFQLFGDIVNIDESAYYVGREF